MAFTQYDKGHIIRFSGNNAYHFYELVKVQKSRDWKVLDHMGLSQFDLCFSENVQNEKEDNIKEFLINCNRKLKATNTYEETNHGKIVHIGSRHYHRYGRI